MINFSKKIIIAFLLLFTITSVAACDHSTTYTLSNSTTNVATTENTHSSTVTTNVTTNVTTTENITTEASTTFITTTTFVDHSELTVTQPTKTNYQVFDSLNLEGMVLSYTNSEGSTTILDANDYIIDDVDMSTYGTKQVFVHYLDYETSFLIQVNLPTYYLSATDLNSAALLDELHRIINNGFAGVSYGDVRYILDETDQDPNNSNNLIEIYTGDSVSGSWDCSGACVWNREHVWPQSRLPVSASNSATNMASDLQNLKPADPSMNSSRGNKFYDNATTPSTFEPRNEVKGDIARILLYMFVMYDQLNLVDSTPGNNEMGLFSVLLEWNAMDPVDDFERNRNEVIYSYQHNRNPFIDYPEFVNLIWENN